MRLLIITQVVDKQHPVLGFFHGWIERFADRCESINVIALQVGEYDLPNNVHVHSLGKEHGVGRIKYLVKFYLLLVGLRKEYDQVFVHMNQIYVLLAGLWWRLTAKRIGLWYAHGAVSVSLWVAVRLAHVVFTSTPQGMRLKTNKLVVTGQGIDPGQFIVGERSQSGTLRLITIGRIAPKKNIDTLLRAVALLRARDINVSFRIIGGPATPTEEQYASEMHALSEKLQVSDLVEWVGPLPHDALPEQLATADVFIHDGATNSLDKTLVEASFAGCIVISSNPSYRALTETIAPDLLFAPEDAKQLEAILHSVSTDHDRARMKAVAVRDSLLQSCSITGLVDKILTRY